MKKSWKDDNMLIKFNESREEDKEEKFKSPEEVEALRRKATSIAQKINEIFKSHGILDFIIKPVDFQYNWNWPKAWQEKGVVGIHLNLIKKNGNHSKTIEEIGLTGWSYNEMIESYEKFRDTIIGDIIKSTLYVNKFPKANELDEFQSNFNNRIEKIKGLAEDFDREIKSLY